MQDSVQQQLSSSRHQKVNIALAPHRLNHHDKVHVCRPKNGNTPVQQEMYVVLQPVALLLDLAKLNIRNIDVVIGIFYVTDDLIYTILVEIRHDFQL